MRMGEETAPPWFQGYSAIFPAVEGPDTGYVASNFMGANINDLIDQWLISPALNVSSGDTLFFWMRSPTPGTTPYDDSVNVLISYSAGTTPSAFTIWKVSSTYKRLAKILSFFCFNRYHSFCNSILYF